MREWFFQNYEDPAQSTPHDSSEGGYQYVWGGPYDALEELGDEFGHLGIPDDLIEEVANDVTSDGIHEWAPTFSRQADMMDRQNSLPFDWLPLALDDKVFLIPENEEHARKNVLERLQALEERLSALEGNPPIVGSNTPPWTTETAPFSASDYLEIQGSVSITRTQTESLEPNKSVLGHEASKLRTFTVRLGKWLLERLNKGADAFVKAVGRLMAEELQSLYGELAQLAETLQQWLSMMVV